MVVRRYDCREELQVGSESRHHHYSVVGRCGSIGYKRGSMINTFETELLSQGYGSRSVIADLTMRGKGPGVLALLGPNGAGKSTLIKTIATVMPHRSGVLKLFGREIRRAADARWARRHIGYLPQEFGFYPSF